MNSVYQPDFCQRLAVRQAGVYIDVDVVEKQDYVVFKAPGVITARSLLMLV